MKYISFKIYFFLILAFGYSCISGEVCEAFNFKRLPFNKSYFLQKLSYTNGKDTVLLSPEIRELSKESKINSIANPDCNPSFAIEFNSKRGNQISFSYSFDYYPQNKYSEMTVMLYWSDCKIKVDLNSKDSVYLIEKFNQPHIKDSNMMVKYVCIKKMRIYEFETLFDEKWRLLN